MAESGRIPQPLRLCRGCREFVRLEHEACPFCNGDLDALETDYQNRLKAMHDAADELRAALARLAQ